MTTFLKSFGAAALLLSSTLLFTSMRADAQMSDDDTASSDSIPSSWPTAHTDESYDTTSKFSTRAKSKLTSPIRQRTAEPRKLDVIDARSSAPIVAAAIRHQLSSNGPIGSDKALNKDRAALVEFYQARNGEPLWVDTAGPTAKALALAVELNNARAYGLNPDAFKLPNFSESSGPTALADTDIALTMAALKYARHARGGRIPDLATLLNTNLDRKPQLHKRGFVLETLASANDVAKALTAFHPVHPQFEKLRQEYLKSTKDGKGGGELSQKAKRLRSNMEFWRWMWDDLGDMYVFNNLPEYMQYVVHNGEVVRSERIVVGLRDKQSSVFSRPLKEVVLRPRWRVPESIMVHELWPSLRGSGGLMRKYGLEITTKSGEKRNWRSIDWTKDDIRNYHVWQASGRNSALGKVKFSFPSQHTIFMHDTPDKWMFAKRTRTLSHGCLRLKNPIDLAEIVLAHDRGWDRAQIDKLVQTGPLDNKIQMQKHIPIHLAYFTAWVGDDGKVKMFEDIYGHEKRVRQALDGDWDKIDKGRNHLAPPKPKLKKRHIARSYPDQQRKKRKTTSNIISNALGAAF